MQIETGICRYKCMIFNEFINNLTQIFVCKPLGPNSPLLRNKSQIKQKQNDLFALSARKCNINTQQFPHVHKLTCLPRDKIYLRITQSNIVYVISYIIALHISPTYLILSIPHLHQANYIFLTIGKKERPKLVETIFSLFIDLISEWKVNMILITTIKIISLEIRWKMAGRHFRPVELLLFKFFEQPCVTLHTAVTIASTDMRTCVQSHSTRGRLRETYYSSLPCVLPLG